LEIGEEGLGIVGEGFLCRIGSLCLYLGISKMESDSRSREVNREREEQAKVEMAAN
jgi:hypothetical protein